MESKDGPMVLEVNGTPDWRGLEAVTGVNPAREIVEYLIRKIKGVE